MTEQEQQLTVLISASPRAIGLAQRLREFIANAGHRVTGVADDEPLSGAPVQSAIANADAVLVVLEDATPSVYYEAGVAAALGKRVLMIGSDVARLPTDLRSFPHVPSGTVPNWWSTTLSGFLAGIVASGPQQRRANQPALEKPSDFELLLHAPGALAAMPVDVVATMMVVILKARGFKVNPPIPRDESWDVIAQEPDGTTLYAQCKVPAIGSMLSVDAVQRASSACDAIGPDAKAMIVTAGMFTNAARDYAQAHEAPIELWDGSRLLGELRIVLQG